MLGALGSLEPTHNHALCVCVCVCVYVCVCVCVPINKTGTVHKAYTTSNPITEYVTISVAPICIFSHLPIPIICLLL